MPFDNERDFVQPTLEVLRQIRRERGQPDPDQVPPTFGEHVGGYRTAALPVLKAAIPTAWERGVKWFKRWF